VSNWAIGIGRLSSDKLLLLRRERVEPALRTFKSIGPREKLVAILPFWHTTMSTLIPGPPSSNPTATTTPVSLALFFR
jgi:hypothetical protein